MAKGTEFKEAMERGVKDLRGALTDVLTEAESLSRMGVLKMESLNLEMELDRVLREVGRAVFEEARRNPGRPIEVAGAVEEHLRHAERIQADRDTKEAELARLRGERGWGHGRGGNGGEPGGSAAASARGGGSAEVP